MIAAAAKGVEFVILIGCAVLVPAAVVAVTDDAAVDVSLFGLVVSVRGSPTVVVVVFVWVFEMWAEVVSEVTAPVVGLDLA